MRISGDGHREPSTRPEVTGVTSRMKLSPNSENEIATGSRHEDPLGSHLTPVLQLPPATAQAIVDALATLVRLAHSVEAEPSTPQGAIKRAQKFEEGDVYMLEAPFEGFFADRYLMDVYDVRSRDMCSRMHMHTGLRFVRMMTGIDTSIRVSSYTEFVVNPSVGWDGGPLFTFEDADDSREAGGRTRYNAIVPANSWVDMQIPRGVSHQFNADGPNAVIDSVHPEESIEVLREEMSGYKMMAQTIFLAAERPPGDRCLLDGDV